MHHEKAFPTEVLRWSAKLINPLIKINYSKLSIFSIKKGAKKPPFKIIKKLIKF
tara:strand:- start:109 stop:270 length:162 start_codon:yes stop_codon:yes gene_type:complete